MSNIIITESQYNRLFEAVDEGVYVNDLNNKKKTAHITYQKGVNYQKGNKNPFDVIKTDKMDENNNDTYLVPLKGGLMSYNITSIRGTEIMHYFKRKFEHQKTMMKIDADEYELEMQDNEFQQFLNQFQTKVNNVISYAYQQFKASNPQVDFSKISIYPVPSSSNFNTKMAGLMANRQFVDLPVQVINQNLLSKDLRNLSKDKEFIKNNKNYYNNQLAPSINGSVDQHIDTTLNKFQSKNNAQENIDEINSVVNCILKDYYYINQYKKKGINYNNILQDLCEWYETYYVDLGELKDALKYNDGVDGKEMKLQISKAAGHIKYSKIPAINKHNEEIWELVKSYFRGSGKNIKMLDIHKWSLTPFEIKTLPNGIRMGMKGMYNPNEDAELVRQELEKIQGTILVIFDDNISGGATLSDICNTCKEMGIQYIIPITFGQMNTKWGYGTNTSAILPVNYKGQEGEFNYQNKKDSKVINILWLDDQRAPERYLASTTKTTDTFYRNKAYYDKLMKKQNVQFKWVKNIEEFSSYIYANGLPDMISFDYNLGKGLPKGDACAQWLRDYCIKTKQPIPNFYVHSANATGIQVIPQILNSVHTAKKE